MTAGKKKKGIPPTVCNFMAVLSSKLTQHDVKESAREMKRGNANIYRLGHLLEAKQKVEADVARVVPNCDVTVTPEIAATIKRSLNTRFNPGFPPIRNVEKQLDAFLASGKQPSLLGARRLGSSKTKLDLILDKVQRGVREVTFDAEGYTKQQLQRLVSTAKNRGLHVSGTKRWILVRSL